MNKHYVNSKELEEWWTGWELTTHDFNWDKMSKMIYKVCLGVTTHFNPRDEEEHTDLAHEAFYLVLEKIKNGKLKNNRKSPVFSLFTTTIFNHLYSKMNREKRRKVHQTKYSWEFVEAKCPEYFQTFDLSIKCPGCGVPISTNPFRNSRNYICFNCNEENQIPLGLFC